MRVLVLITGLSPGWRFERKTGLEARLQISLSDRDAELKCCLGMELIRGHYVLERGAKKALRPGNRRAWRLHSGVCEAGAARREGSA